MDDMKQLVLTTLGLLGLSVAGGAALFASHAAFAAGPRLPEYIIRANAIAASRMAEAEVMDLDTIEQAEAAMPAIVVVTEGAGATPFLSSQGTDSYAPYRTLRPVARSEARAAIVAASAVTPLRRATVATVTSNRRVVPLEQAPTLRRSAAPRASVGTQPVVQRASNRIDPGYLHGVFR